MYKIQVEIECGTGSDIFWYWATLNDSYRRSDNAECVLDSLLEQDAIISGRVIKTYEIIFEK